MLEVAGSLATPAERAPGNTAPRSNPAPRRSEPPRDGYRATACTLPRRGGCSGTHLAGCRHLPLLAAAGRRRQVRGRTGARRGLTPHR